MHIINLFLKLFKTPFRFYTWFAIIFFGANVISLGLLSMLSYFLVYPVLFFMWDRNPFGTDYHGDWMWPAVLLIGFAISFFIFLLGIINHYQIKFGWRKKTRVFSQVLIIWLFILLCWVLFHKTGEEYLKQERTNNNIELPA